MAEARPARIYCSELARQAPSTLHGTAIQVDMWLMLEYPRPWKAKALDDNELPAEVNAHLAELAAQLADQYSVKLRVQFIKQSGSAETPTRIAYLADVRVNQQRMVRWEFHSVQQLLELTANQLHEFVLPPDTASERCEEEIYLVCTNGQRDVCCARFGLPLYESLRVAQGHRIWQTSHLGGHRYAPNLLCLPSGVVYGFVDPDDGEQIVRQHDTGAVCVENLRGRSAFSAAAQSAEYFLRQHLDAAVRLELVSHFQEAWDGGDSVVLTGPVRINENEHAVKVQLSFHAQIEVAIASCGAKEKSIGGYRLVACDVALS